MAVSNLLFSVGICWEFVGGPHRGPSSATALPGQVTAWWHLCNSISEQTGAKRQSEMQQGRAERVAIFALEIKTCQHCSFSCKPDHTQHNSDGRHKHTRHRNPSCASAQGWAAHTISLREMGGILISHCLFLCPDVTWVPPRSSLAAQAPPARSITAITVPMSAAHGLSESWLRDRPHCPAADISPRVAKPASNQVLSLYCSGSAPGASVPALVLKLLTPSRLWAGQCTERAAHTQDQTITPNTCFWGWDTGICYFSINKH